MVALILKAGNESLLTLTWLFMLAATKSRGFEMLIPVIGSEVTGLLDDVLDFVAQSAS